MAAASKVRVGEAHAAKVYAEALLRAASAAGQLSEVTEEFVFLIDELFAREPQVEALLTSVIVTVGHKDEIIDRAFRGKFSEVFVNFLHVLNHHGRLDLLRAIRQEGAALLNEQAHRRNVFVETAQPLTDGMREKLIQTLKQRMKMEPVLVENVNPELIGGFVLRVADYRFDGSVRNQLQSLQKHLMERSDHEIQSRRDRFSPAN